MSDGQAQIATTITGNTGLSKSHERGSEPSDPRFHVRRNLGSIDVEDLDKTVIAPSVIPRLSEMPGKIRPLGPRLGERADSVPTE
ncbi:MAG: hypothetical protein U1F70_07235 [Candidatus Competibacteraceae bacterium]